MLTSARPERAVHIDLGLLLHWPFPYPRRKVQGSKAGIPLAKSPSSSLLMHFISLWGEAALPVIAAVPTQLLLLYPTCGENLSPQGAAAGCCWTRQPNVSLRR